MNRPLSEAFCEVAALAERLGIKNIASHGRPWVHKIDDSWVLAINGTKEPQECRPEGTMGADIQPFHMAVWYNGWLAALLNPYEGVFLNGSENDFIAAVKGAQLAPA